MTISKRRRERKKKESTKNRPHCTRGMAMSPMGGRSLLRYRTEQPLQSDLRMYGSYLPKDSWCGENPTIRSRQQTEKIFYSTAPTKTHAKKNADRTRLLLIQQLFEKTKRKNNLTSDERYSYVARSEGPEQVRNSSVVIICET